MRGLKRPCKHCRDRFIPKRSDAEFCSNLCRQAAYFKRDRRRKAVTAAELAVRRHQEGLAAIAAFDRYQSLVGALHVVARELNINLRFMATRIGVLVVEGGAGAFGSFFKRGFPGYALIGGWYREIKTRSDGREIVALLSQESLGGPYIATEAERECRSLLALAPTEVSLFVEDWADYWTRRPPPYFSTPDIYDDDDRVDGEKAAPWQWIDGGPEFMAEGFQIVDARKV